MKSFLVALLFCSMCFAQAPTGFWTTAHYPIFWYTSPTPKQIDYNALTHLIIFTTECSSVSPYFREVAGSIDSCNFDGGYCGGYNMPAGSRKATVDSAHAHGVKVLMCIAQLGGKSGNMGAMMADPIKRTTFISYVAGRNSFISRRNFDGIDIDWEYPSSSDGANFSAFINEVYDTMATWMKSPPVITMDVTLYTFPAWVTAMPTLNSSKIAQVNLMMYGMASSVTTFSSPIEQNKKLYPNYNGTAWYNAKDAGGNLFNHGAVAWIKAGLSRKKLGVLIPFEMQKRSGTDAPGQTGGGSYQLVDYKEVLNMIQTYGQSIVHWDSVGKCPWLGFTDSKGVKWFYSYENPTSIQIKTQIAIDSGYGGVGTWELGRGYVSTSTPPDILLQTVKSTVNRISVSPVPPVPPTPLPQPVSTCNYDSAKATVKCPVCPPLIDTTGLAYTNWKLGWNACVSAIIDCVKVKQIKPTIK